MFLDNTLSGIIIEFFYKFMFIFFEVPILVYHSISDYHRESLQLNMFRKQLDFFRKNKFNIISLKALKDNLQGMRKQTGHPICLTFDDGYEDFFYNVWPLLRDYGFPATIFLVVNKIGRQGYLKISQIKEMSAAGLISVGSHTMSHRYLLDLDKQQLKSEIEESKMILESNLGLEIDFFSYPWGAFSYDIQRMVKDAGYKMAFSTNLGVSRTIRHKDAYAIKRLTMNKNDSFLRFLIKVSGFGYIFSRKLKFNKS